MSTPPAPPPPGWDPSPDGSSTSMWWDGAQWVPQQQAALPGPTPAQPSPTAAAGYRSAHYPVNQWQPVTTPPPVKLAIATQVLLLVTAVSALANIAHESFGIAGATDFLGGDDSAMSRLRTYDLFALPITVFGLICMIATGVLWVVWQYHAAKQVPGRTRRSPGWHAGAWFVPVVSLWFPYQNITDLWRATGRSRPSWQILWWVLWLASNVTAQVSSRLYAVAQDLELLRVSMWIDIVGEILTLAAVPFAVLIVRGITRDLQRISPVAPRPVH